jgi:hypothetical protein
MSYPIPPDFIVLGDDLYIRLNDGLLIPVMNDDITMLEAEPE